MRLTRRRFDKMLLGWVPVLYIHIGIIIIIILHLLPVRVAFNVCLYIMMDLSSTHIRYHRAGFKFFFFKNANHSLTIHRCIIMYTRARLCVCIRDYLRL